MVAPLIAVLFTLAGCGTSDPESGTADQPFNEADVAFATEMIWHHSQALQMVDIAMDRQLDPEVQALADDIKAAQAPEIETMSGWLEDWDQPVPDGKEMTDHTGMDMPGMMSGEDMQALEDVRGEAFQEMWLTMMIKHHEGAIEQAEAEQEKGEFAPAIELANEIKATQQAEIDKMQMLLDS